MFVPCEVSSYDQQVAAFKAVWARWGQLDVFVANAGMVDSDSKYNFTRRNAPVDDIPPEPHTSTVDVDLKGVIYGTVLAVHFMRHNQGLAAGGSQQPRGRIIVTGSGLALNIGVTFPEYAAAKAGDTHWVCTMAPLLLRKDNITINIVHPGAYDTTIYPGFTDAFLPQHLVVRETLIAAYDHFIENGTRAAAQRTGMVVEVAHDKLFFHDLPEDKSGDVARRNELPYEPWFAGATGTQGGGVINIMSKTPGWKIRAITRDPDGGKGKVLAAQGFEVVRADFDDEESLVKAFEGAHAVFAVSNWWEHLFRGKSADECGPLEEEQGINLARAAARTSSLEHCIWSSEPSAARVYPAGVGVVKAPHMDFKNKVNERIKSELPLLAARTTFLWLGYYPQNMAFFPCLILTFHPALGKYVQTVASAPDAKVLLASDVTVNTGIWVRQVLAAGHRAQRSRIANVVLERWTFQQMMDEWSLITGKPGVYVQCTAEAYERLWGPVGAELALQFKLGELCDPWAETTGEFLTAEELRINDKEVVGFAGTIKKFHAMGIWNKAK
ncbi:hypothetical protein RB601_008236 [Gaeumannomyces tritici]